RKSLPQRTQSDTKTFLSFSFVFLRVLRGKSSCLFGSGLSGLGDDMSLQRILLITLGILIVALGGACSEVSAPSTPTEAAPTADPSEFLRISGQGSFVSEPFQLEGSGGLRVYWRQDCNDFLLLMENTNEALAEAPMGRVTFESASEPSEYVQDSPYVAPFKYVVGEYVFKIEAEEGCSWEIWAKIEYPEGE
ncbi:MAG: hypothetical protein U9Q82_01505, partial [Chloroflexota bacterium]|nr:hypothetical protein [Chloroflexota bacterium]